MAAVALRIVLDVSYDADKPRESLFVAAAKFGEGACHFSWQAQRFVKF